MLPKNHVYIKALKASLERINVGVQLIEPFHYSTLTNIAKMCFFRRKGHRIIHVHWLYVFPFGFVMKWFYFFCKVLRIKVIWEMHNILPHDYNETDRKRAKWFYERVDAIIFHCRDDVQRSKKELRTDINKRHIVTPHGNFNDIYPNEISRESARAKLGIEKNAKVLLCFGSIRKNRGYEYLIEAIRNESDKILIIAGRIEDKNTLKTILKYKQLNSNIRLIAEWISDRDVQVYFNACDVVILPYTDITTSGVVPLAYAFSRPVITTDVGGLRDVVNDKTGLLVRARDSTALSDAISKIFQIDYNAMGKQALEYAQRELSWEFSAGRMKELYEQIAGDE